MKKFILLAVLTLTVFSGMRSYAKCENVKNSNTTFAAQTLEKYVKSG